MNFSNIAGLMLSGGASSRAIAQGKPPKALIKASSGKTSLEEISRAMSIFKLNKFVVLGKHFEEINPLASKLKLNIVNNKAWEKGMLSSIQAGISEISKGSFDGFILWPVDCVNVHDETLLAILFATQKHKNSIIIPSFEGKGGHPTYFPKNTFLEFNKIPEGSGADFIVKNSKDVIYIDVKDENILSNKNFG